jgi:hypothetical protein
MSRAGFCWTNGFTLRDYRPFHAHLDGATVAMPGLAQKTAAGLAGNGAGLFRDTGAPGAHRAVNTNKQHGPRRHKATPARGDAREGITDEQDH